MDGLDNSIVNCNTATTVKTHTSSWCHNYRLRVYSSSLLETETNVNFDYAVLVPVKE